MWDTNNRWGSRILHICRYLYAFIFMMDVSVVNHFL